MPNSNQGSRPNATIINIHSPNDEIYSLQEDQDFRRQSNASKQYAPTKLSPKVEEYKKMIQHIIGKIMKRKRPPNSLHHLSDICKSANVSDQFDNDDTIDLLIQLRSALLVCHQVGLSNQVLIQGERTPTGSPSSSRANSPTPSPRTASPSKSTDNASSHIPIPKSEKRTEFETVLYVLSDLILNDSRFKTANPKPSRPSFTMQTILIDIALVLVQMRDDSAGLYQIGTVFLPAFESFSDGSMLGKLLSLFLDNLLPKLMSCKDEHKTRSIDVRKSPRSSTTKSSQNRSQSHQNTPTITIENSEPTNTNPPLKMSHLTIDTRPYSSDMAGPVSPISPAGQSYQSSTHGQTIDNYYAYALFTPLLLFMIQYLDPYLAAQSTKAQQENLNFTLTQQANSIHNFHRALSYMTSCKPDLYLDILDVISHSTSEVKFRACQILLNYYFISVGHVIIADSLPPLGTQEEVEILDQRREQQAFEEQHQRNNQHNQPRTQHGNRNKLDSYNLAGIDLHNEDEDEDHHVWYPHLFQYLPKKHSDYVQTLEDESAFPLVHDDVNEAFCKECFKVIKGFGLRCFQCKGCVHYNCSSAVTGLKDQGIMFYVKSGGIQKVVTPQYCVIPPQPRFRDMVNRGLMGWTIKSDSSKVGLLGHTFELVNLYTLMMCACCGLPLWGISQQGYRCGECNHFVHVQCLAEAEEKRSFSIKKHINNDSAFQTCVPFQPLKESDLQISQNNLSKNFLEFYGDLVPSSIEALEGKSLEEVGTILNVLSLQDRILHCGVAAGSILIIDESDDPLQPTRDGAIDNSLSDFNDEYPSHCPALTLAIKTCNNYLSLNKARGSTFYNDFYENQIQTTNNFMLTHEEYLSHLSAMMKCLMTVFTPQYSSQQQTFENRRSLGDSRGFLQVSQNPFMTNWEEEEEDFGDGHIPNEYLDRSVILSWLMTNLNFKSRKTAEILLQHMRNLGLFERFDASPILFPNISMKEQQQLIEQEKVIQCIFPVPYAIDSSPAVESLINSIEACLQDVDLSINECGLLLLVRRCWPDPFMSNYTKERLIQAIASWIFDEDERLLTLYSEMTSGSKARQMNPKQNNKWAQAALLSRMKGAPQNVPERNRKSALFQTNTAGVSSGASTMYVSTRTALRDRYIVRWMETIHDMDNKAYTETLFTVIEDIIDSKREECIIPLWEESYNNKKLTIQKYDLFISYIVKLKTNGLIFTALDPILQRWLERTHIEFSNLGILQDKEPVDIRHLAKLCSTKGSSSKVSGSSSSPNESDGPIETIMTQFVAGDSFSINRGMRWLTLLVNSGAGVPSESLSRMARLIINAHTPLDIIAEFIKAVWCQAANVVSIPTPRSAVLDIIGYLNDASLDTLTANNENQSLSDRDLSSAQTLIKYSAALACYALGCPIKNISELGIVPYVRDNVTNTPNQSKRYSGQSETIVPIQADEKIPLIKCLLIYLRFDQLNSQEDIIKAFYALTYWGYGISNKDEFISKCMPQLIPSVWELLTPTYDYLSNINLNLLMKLISIDVRYFQACVFKVFEDANWEVRYQGLDNLFGLFTKMDAAFQTEWLELLSHLGPVFSYFVGCLWDKEEYVRSKAHALIRTFGTLHLRSAFRCWEAYFLTATDRQRMSLVSLMIQLNALFPDWQVLQWESLLEALEMKTPVDILDDYLRPPSMDQNLIKSDTDISANDSGNQNQQSAESENVKVLMLTLALQLLSNHLSIELAQIFKLKFVLVQQMGFQNCQYFENNGEITVKFEHLKYNPKDPSKVAVMISCVRGLKKIMDSFAPLPAEAVAMMASESLEQNRMNLSENSSPGVHFIDIVLKMMNSGIDLTKLGHIVLKAWLEIILIVIYKHNVLDREYEQSIVTCMKQIIDLLTEEISEENKLLILEILKCLLRRSDHLTAMVLSKQILSLGKLMTKLGIRNSEPVYLKAKQFLKSAFLRFAVAGLFVLMFKNQTVSDTANSDVDLFFVLRTVIDQNDIIPDEDMNGEIIYLRDQPLRDVIDKLMKQQMERRAFSTVLHNTGRYVETVHTHPYSENILNSYAGFMSALIKHTADWRRSDWNINPVFTMSAILLKEHPYHHSVLLLPLQALFKHGLLNCTIQPEAIVKLMAAYSTLSSIPGTQPNNIFVDILIDEIKTSLTTSTRVHKDTLLVMLQLVLWDIKPMGQEWYANVEIPFLGKGHNVNNRTPYFENKLLTLLPYFVNYLKKPSNSQQFTRKDFKVYSCTAHLIISMCSRDPKLMVIIFGYLKLEESTECLRFLTWFILTLLKEGADTLLSNMLEYEIVLTELLVKAFNTLEIDFHTPDLNFSLSQSSEKLSFCFLLVKAYVLLKIRDGSIDKTTSINTKALNPLSFWMTLWPTIRKLLESIELTTLFVTGNVGVSIWDMFLSLLQFLFTSRSEVVMLNAYEWCDLLEDLLNKLKESNESVNHEASMDSLVQLDTFKKQVENLKEMFNMPPIEVPSEIMVSQLILELRDVMRSQAENFTFQGNARTLTQNIVNPLFNY